MRRELREDGRVYTIYTGEEFMRMRRVRYWKEAIKNALIALLSSVAASAVTLAILMR